MKAKLLLSFFIFLSISQITIGKDHPKTQKIALKCHKKIQRRSIIEQPLYAFIDAFGIFIEQDSSLEAFSYTTTITNMDTGEIIEIFTVTGDSYCNTNNLYPGEYSIEIDLRDMTLYGSFTITR